MIFVIFVIFVISILVEEKVEPKKTEKVWTAGEVREVEGGDLIIFFMITMMMTQKNDTWFLLSFSVTLDI